MAAFNKVKPPSGPTQVFTYNPGTIARTAQGKYRQSFTPTVSGMHYVAWEGTGAAAGAGESAFLVRQRQAP